jgi:hypothetical protein
MRTKAPMALAMLLIVLFANRSCAIDWNNPESYQSVDDLLSSGSGGPSLTEQAQAARSAEMGQPGKEILGNHFGNNSSSKASTSTQVRSQGQNQINSIQPAAANAIPRAASQPLQSSPIFIAGVWNFEIAAGKPIYANITLVQSTDAIYGKGKIMDENSTKAAVASGSINGDVLNLDLVSTDDLRLYRLTLTVSGSSATGNNTGYALNESSSTGQARGFRS